MDLDLDQASQLKDQESESIGHMLENQIYDLSLKYVPVLESAD